MMNAKFLLASVLSVCVGSMAVMAEPISYIEQWDTYEDGYDGPDYNLNWPTDSAVLSITVPSPSPRGGMIDPLSPPKERGVRIEPGRCCWATASWALTSTPKQTATANLKMTFIASAPNCATWFATS